MPAFVTSLTRSRGGLTWLILAIASMGVLAPWAAEAQYQHTCSDVDPPTHVSGDFYLYQECQFNFDGDAVYDRTAKFYENRGSAWDPPHEDPDRDDRHCYQGTQFVGTEPDADDFGYIHFSLLLPDDPELGFPLLIALRGGGPGWSDINDTPVDSWRLDADVNPFEWDQGKYHSSLDLGDGTKDETVIRGFLADDDGNVVDELRQAFPGWGILVPSGCSHDLWNGHDDLDAQKQEWKNAAQTRYSYAALVEALTMVNTEYGIDYLYVVGGSGGGAGGLLLARDLQSDLPTGVQFRGVVSEAAPFETVARGQLYDNNTERDVDSDESCTGALETTVPCEAPAEPFSTAYTEVGLEFSASEEIDPQIGTGITVPILHMYNKRDRAHCYDCRYSQQNLHGPINQAINNRKNDGNAEAFDNSENVEMCTGSCTGDDGTLLDCTRHTVLGWRESDPVDQAVTCAVEWIEALEDYYAGNTYARPASCDDIEQDTGSQNAGPCDEQDETLF